MNPEISQGSDYDRGYADGWRERGVQQLVIDLRDNQNITPEDLEYLADMCKNMSCKSREVLEIVQ